MHHRTTRSALVLLLAVAACEDPDAGYQPQVVALGDPSFKPVDFHLLTAEVGTEDDMFAGFGKTIGVLLPEPDHKPHPNLGIGPGDPHPPPYDGEFTEYIAAAGFHEDVVFTNAEQGEGNGVFFTLLLVPGPGAPVGSSPDFESGPILPHTSFPLHVVADLYKDGEDADEHVIFDVPALDVIDPPFAVDGHSHVPLFFATWINLGFTATGDYEWRVTVTDNGGAGHKITAPWELVP